MRDDDNSHQPVLVEHQGRAALVTLNRPEALNALNLDMIRALETCLHTCAKTPKIYGLLLEAKGRAFCAGGDLRAFYAFRQHGQEAAALDYYREEYQHCWTLQSFIKPHVALINGAVMGGGAGISLYGTHRVAGENFTLAMPETGIGFFPDIGASYFLPRLPGKTGLYLGLTGAAIGPADAYHLRLASHCVRARDFGLIRDALIACDPIDQVLDALHTDPREGPVLRMQDVINRCFEAGSVEEILARLDAQSGAAAEWARQTAARLRACSPLGLKATFHLLECAARPESLKQALMLEFRLAARMLQAGDFYEGIRAAVVDKDKAPRWGARLEEIGQARVEALFEPLSGGELGLNDYWTLVD